MIRCPPLNRLGVDVRASTEQLLDYFNMARRRRSVQRSVAVPSLRCCCDIDTCSKRPLDLCYVSPVRSSVQHGQLVIALRRTRSAPSCYTYG
eukprot:COSAG03_NODE_10233_length_663_cov_1.069149_2_plen_91_part_01